MCHAPLFKCLPRGKPSLSFASSMRTTAFYRNQLFVSGVICALSLATAGCRRQEPDKQPEPQPPATRQAWALRDSAPYNLTTLDPVGIVDAFSVNVLANVYEGLVATDPEGRIVPALAERWDISPDGRVYTFHLRTNALFEPPPDSGFQPRPVTAQDVVFSLNRASFSKQSLYGWLLGGLLASAQSVDFDAGERHPDIIAVDQNTVRIRLAHAFPLLNRLVTVGGWVYPAEVVRKDPNALTKATFGTGPYRLKAFVPDDRIELVRSSAGARWADLPGPSSVVIRVLADPVAALQAFRAGELDGIELDLGTIRQGEALAAQGGANLVGVVANYLDYIVVRNDQPPFNDLRVRRALNLAVDREGLRLALSGLAEPAFGFVPPASPAYRGQEAIRRSGFRFDPEQARKLLAEYLAEKGQSSLTMDLVFDAGEFSETIAQYVQAQWRKNLPALQVNLKRITWAELLQQAFSGQGVCYRFWWNIVTPSEDLYFLFYFPGQNPPNGFNLSFYANPGFERAYRDVFAIAEAAERMKQVASLEDMLIADAAAIPLVHRRFAYLVRPGIRIPINGFLRKHYALAVDERSTAK
ncbi:MAG: ABC transporter substrate-binding protein [Verrucomicrobiales bacterium]|nr:ABC transporter substrate-binding protein [Verrucomicrobiales bacterium]